MATAKKASKKHHTQPGTTEEINPSPDPQNDAAKTVMIIDDDLEIRQLIADILTDAGYRVQTGVGVTDLYEVEKAPPSLILIDHWLDGKTGRDICYQLKTNPLTDHIPVVLISATTNLEQTAISCRADGFIQKPFEVDDLLEKVAAITDKG
jgi:DNA-binding response OmpR family regulator